MPCYFWLRRTSEKVSRRSFRQTDTGAKKWREKFGPESFQKIHLGAKVGGRRSRPYFGTPTPFSGRASGEAWCRGGRAAYGGAARQGGAHRGEAALLPLLPADRERAGERRVKRQICFEIRIPSASPNAASAMRTVPKIVPSGGLLLFVCGMGQQQNIKPERSSAGWKTHQARSMRRLCIQLLMLLDSESRKSRSRAKTLCTYSRGTARLEIRGEKAVHLF